jgi:hypothetical protein
LPEELELLAKSMVAMPAIPVVSMGDASSSWLLEGAFTESGLGVAVFDNRIDQPDPAQITFLEQVVKKGMAISPLHPTQPGVFDTSIAIGMARGGIIINCEDERTMAEARLAVACKLPLAVLDFRTKKGLTNPLGNQALLDNARSIKSPVIPLSLADLKGTLANFNPFVPSNLW